jgi:hypothetical protein
MSTVIYQVRTSIDIATRQALSSTSTNMFALLWTAYRYFVPLPAPAPSSTQDTSLWFRLPLELREEIYILLFSDHAFEPLYISPGNKSVLAGPVLQGRYHAALLRTCKAVHAEAIPILHATHNIHLLLSDPLHLSRLPSPCSATPTTYLPKTLVCSRDHMLELIAHRFKYLTITVRLTSVSSGTLIVQKLAWILEMLRRREGNLEHLTLHILDNLSFFSGCCPATDYNEGSRWDVYSERALVETSNSGVIGGGESSAKELLDLCADDWEVTVSMNEGRIAMGQTARGHWGRLSGDFQGVESTLKKEMPWWSGVQAVDVWESIQERRQGGYWVR